MKLRAGKKKQPVRTTRQRRESGPTEAPAAYAYHAQRAERTEATGRQQSSLAEKRGRLLSMRFWARRSGILAVTVIALLFSVVLLGLSTKPQIILVDSGNTYAFQSPEKYQEAATEQLSSSLWNRNKITVNTGGAAASLQKQFPELSQVNITLPLIGQSPVYYLEANAPAFVLQTLNGTFVLDSNGKALISKASAPAEVIANLPVLTDQTGLKVEVGKQVISGTNADFIQTVVATLASKQITVESLTFPANNVQELDVRVTGKPYVIKFDMHDSGAARQQTGTYLATDSNLSGQGKTPGQYIDVRVLGRVYYQ